MFLLLVIIIFFFYTITCINIKLSNSQLLCVFFFFKKLENLDNFFSELFKKRSFVVKIYYDKKEGFCSREQKIFLSTITTKFATFGSH